MPAAVYHPNSLACAVPSSVGLRGHARVVAVLVTKTAQQAEVGVPSSVQAAQVANYACPKLKSTMPVHLTGHSTAWGWAEGVQASSGPVQPSRAQNRAAGRGRE